MPRANILTTWDGPRREYFNPGLLDYREIGLLVQKVDSEEQSNELNLRESQLTQP